MDETDPNIVFDAQGVCNHCYRFDQVQASQMYDGRDGAARLNKIVEKIKHAGRKNEYDCILGLSGGVDSSYLALKARDFGLRPLVMHVDAGWNSELAVSNIEKVVKYCNYDLHTHVVNWEDMRDLQLSYMKAGVANQDVPQDHAYFSNLYHFAVQHKIKYILSGGNLATESVFPQAWHGSAMDAINLNAIHASFSSRPLVDYKTISFAQYYLWYPLVRGMRTVRPLNFIGYDKKQAERYLKDTIDYRTYAHKHGESVFTKFFQNYYLPQRFSYDKRKLHYSSMILSGQLSREVALVGLSQPLYGSSELEADITYICKKIRLTRSQFDELLTAPIRHHTEFANWNARQLFLKKMQYAIQRVSGRTLSIYS